MNAKLAKKIRKVQRQQMTEIPEGVRQAIEKAFLHGVEVGWMRAKNRFETESGEEWTWGDLA